jgi:predicted alpha/beta hydrolase family esterase
MGSSTIHKNENQRVLIAPGFGSSGPEHWQTLWQKENPEFIRIEQKNWNEPIAKDWIESIEKQVAEIGSECVIVAHSLACIALTLWSTQTKLKIKGALLIAPPDTESPDFRLNVKGFSSIPTHKLPFQSIVVSSTNDQYCSIERSENLAQNWGSQFVNIGAKGHINAESNIGYWHEGRHFLSKIQ